MTARQLAYRDYLLTPHWQSLRREVLSRDGFRCRRCPARKRLQAHHLIYRARFEDSVADDLITLCHLCHKSEHGLIRKTKHGWKAKKPPKINKPFVYRDPATVFAEAEASLNRFETLGKKIRKQLAAIGRDSNNPHRKLAQAIQSRNSALKSHVFQAWQPNSERCVCGRYKGFHRQPGFRI